VGAARIRRISRTLAGLLACFCIQASDLAFAAEAILTGHARTIDGDTIEIGAVPVRLKGIAAPERDEPGGAEATEAMRRLIGDKEVRCELTGERTHRRAVGFAAREMST
jgi:endonuclease YncB( thermonuclease family)